MKIKLLIRNKNAVVGPEWTKIIERPYRPPKGMVFTIGGIIDEAYVDGFYDEIPNDKGYDIEIWLHTDDDDGLKKLQSAGWVPN